MRPIAEFAARAESMDFSNASVADNGSFGAYLRISGLETTATIALQSCTIH
jgi:hypothetical protein